MREIKFRGVRVDNGEWVYGDLWRNPYGKVGFVNIVSFYEDTGTTGGLNVFPETVGQYTGLKDDDGIEIYEGDILECLNEVGEMSEHDSDTGIGTVEWLERYGFWNISGIENGLGDINEFGFTKVIGNIHENPELLEKG